MKNRKVYHPFITHMIESDRDYKDPKNQSVLTDAHLDKIVATYRATPLELADNDFNLNIPRYVDPFEKAAEIDLKVGKKKSPNWRQNSPPCGRRWTAISRSSACNRSCAKPSIASISRVQFHPESPLPKKGIRLNYS